MKSLRKSIDKMCKQCIYDPHPGNGTWRQQVEACTSKDCALFDVRPKSYGPHQELGERLMENTW